MKYRGIYKVLILSAFLMFFSESAFSQLILETFDEIDASNYPICSVTLKAENNGADVKITSDRLVIMENNNSTRPFEIIDNSDGTQLVKWKSVLRSEYEGAVFYFTNNSETATNMAYYKDLKNYISQVRIYPSNSEYQKNIYFNTPDIGETYNVRLDIKAVITPYMGNDVYRKIRIDSVKTHTKDFSVAWYGNSDPNSGTLPCMIENARTYGIFVRFSGMEPKLYTDRLTVYYEGGIIEEVNLIANSYKITTKTILTLLEPAAGTHLTPCQVIKIKWKGNVPGLPTFVDYSLNNGITWEYIGESQDSTITWKVPNSITNNLLIRVKQNAKALPNKSLTFDDIPFAQCRFSDNSLYILGINDAGKAYEWDLTQDPPVRSPEYNIGSFQYPTDRLFNHFIGYTNDHKSFVTAYRFTSLPAQVQRDTIAFFNVGTYEPYKKIAFPRGFRISKILIDYQKRWITILPTNSNILKLYSPADGTFIKDVVFDTPITDFSFSNGADSLVALMRDNSIRIVDLKDFSTTNKIQFTDQQLFSNVALSPNGKYLTFANYIPFATSFIPSWAEPKSNTYIYEISSGMIVRNLKPVSTDAIGLDFNPTSNKVIRASTAQPHLVFSDLSDPSVVEEMSLSETSLDYYSFAPEGHRIAAIAKEINMFKVQTFTYSEADVNDEPIFIEYPDIEIKNISIEQKYIGTENPYIYTANFYNKGVVPFLMENMRLLHNINFKLRNITVPDTIFPGEYLTVDLVYNPIDTGIVTDSIVFSTCAMDTYLKLDSRGLPRNIQFYSDNFNFGDVCLGKAFPKKITLLKNLDPAPLRINNIDFFDKSDRPFYMTNSFRDTIIEAGQSLEVEITFSPTVLRENIKTLKVFHSNQQYMTADTKVSGNGIGTDLSIPLSDLRFVPEIKKRIITIHNNQANDVELSSYSFAPTDKYKINATIPMIVKGLDSVQIEVECLTDMPENSVLEFLTAPCYNSYKVYIGLFTGSSNISVNNVEADPRGTATITVNYNNKYPKAYNGKMEFEGELTINPRMFIPYGDNQAVCPYGTATITKNQVINDKRVIGFKVEGIFPDNGVLININGVAALAEMQTSPIEFVQTAKGWSSTVQHNYSNGTFKLINVCGDRYLQQATEAVQIQKINPNPVNEKFDLYVNSRIPENCTIEIYDMNGNLISTTSSIQLIAGDNKLTINTEYLISGNYKIILKTPDGIAVGTFVVVK